MPRRKTTSAASKKTKPEVIEHVTPRQGITAYARSSFKWAESYTSLLMGIVVVIVGVLFIVSIVRQTHHIQDTSSVAIGPTVTPTPTNAQKTPTPTTVVKKAPTPTRTLQEPTATPAPKMAMHQSAKTKPAQKTYIVQKGDDLWDISEKVYGSGYNYVDIIRANNLSNPSMIFTGDKLILPEVTPVIAQSNDQNQTQLSQQNVQNITPQLQSQSIKGSSYTVQKGDDLWDIAVRAYADGYRWVDIAHANNISDPGLIFSGNVLKIPR